MQRSYLPRSDMGVVLFTQSFAANLTKDPHRFGVQPETAAAYAALQDEFAQAMKRAEDPQTRTPVAVLRKQSLRESLEARTRELVRLILARPGTSNEDRTTLGLPQRGALAVPKGRPKAKPQVEVRRVDGNRVTLELYGQTADGHVTARKPAGVKGATLFTAVGPEPPTAPDDWRYERATLERRVQLTFPHTLPPGTRVWITAFWLNDRLERGPASQPVGAYLGAGMAAVGAMGDVAA